jgi:hypothetical protein
MVLVVEAVLFANSWRRLPLVPFWVFAICRGSGFLLHAQQAIGRECTVAVVGSMLLALYYTI